MKPWKEPLLHFFVLGLAVFGLHALLERRTAPPAEDPLLVEVSSADVEWLRTLSRKRMGREPSAQELRGQVNQLVREQILEREALAVGLGEGDTIIRRRLAQKLEFLLNDVSGAVEPSEDELKSFLEDNRERFEEPARVSFTQVFFSVDRRGVEQAERAARETLERLQSQRDQPPDPAALGDPTMLPARCDDCTAGRAQSSFGADFTEAVLGLEAGSWHGPLRSSFGFHAVFVDARQDASLPAYADVRDAVVREWLFREQQEGSRRLYDELRSRYRVLVEGMPWELDRTGEESGS